jgi:hypothetical protein
MAMLDDGFAAEPQAKAAAGQGRFLASAAARFWDRLGVLCYEHPIRAVYGGALDYLRNASPSLRRAILASIPAEHGPIAAWPQIMRENGADAVAADEALRAVLELEETAAEPQAKAAREPERELEETAAEQQAKATREPEREPERVPEREPQAAPAAE